MINSNIFPDDGFFFYSDLYGEHGFDFGIKQYYEFIYILEGAFLYIADGRIYPAASGDFIFTSPYEISRLKPSGNGTARIQTLRIFPSFTEPVSKILPDITSKALGSSNLIPMRIMTKYNIFEIFSQIREFISVKTPETNVMVLSYVMQLFSKLSAVFRNENISQSPAPDNYELRRLFEFADKNFTRNINMDIVSDHMYIDKSYIGRIFKKYTGMTPKAYINLKRTAAAKDMILSGSMPTDIYKKCGFSDYSTFYRSFKKYTGISPEKIKAQK